MSKMPAKKKSCFQITSVTTAQGSGSLADDTESLDGDPDESRSEDVSSEVFDVSRKEGPGPQPVTTGRSSSEETLNHAGSPGTVSPNPLQAPAAPATCSSRFRVIKLDHGSGEPYRRGRWTCVEYYERETDTIRHGHATESSGERDSGLGGSQVGLEPLADNPVSHLGQAPPQQHFLIGQQHPQAEAVPPLHSGQHMVAQGQSQTGHNGKGGPKGMAGPAGHNGKGAVAPPVSQAQQFAYFQSQVAPAQRNPAQAPVTQPDYIRNAPHTRGASNIPVSVASSHPLGQSNSTGRAQGLGLGVDSGVQGAALSHIAQPPTSHPAVTLQAGGVVQLGVAPTGLVQPKLVTQHQPTGTSAGLTMPTTSVVAHNVPVAASSTSVFVASSNASATAMPNDPGTVVQSQQVSHTTVTRSASLIQPIGLPELQGVANVNSHMLQSNSHFQTQGFAQIDDRRKSEPLPQPPSSLIADHTPFMKPPVLDNFTNPLHLSATTPINSLARSVFGISIPVDGDEDRKMLFFSDIYFRDFFLTMQKLADFSVSSASVVAIDNKIEQAMDLVKSHLMFAVREEVEVLKEQIKELIEKNSTLERENALLKSLTNNDHLTQLSTQSVSLSNTSQHKTVMAQKLQTPQPSQQPNVSSA